MVGPLSERTGRLEGSVVQVQQLDGSVEIRLATLLYVHPPGGCDAATSQGQTLTCSGSRPRSDTLAR